MIDISVLLTTVDRYDELFRAVTSLAHIKSYSFEVIVLENAPAISWGGRLTNALSPDLAGRKKLIKVADRLPVTAARNLLARHASGEYLLIIDDDAFLLNGIGISRAIKILNDDAGVGAIAFAQCDNAGNLPLGFAQPAPREVPCLTCGFSAYGTMVRRKPFIELGGFREVLEMGGEENEFCRRLWGANLKVVYIPDRTICHEPSAVSRNMNRRAMLQSRNVVLDGLLNEPIYLLPITIPMRFVKVWRFLRHSQGWHQQRPSVMMWRVTLSLLSRLVPTLRDRKAIPLKFHRQWQMIKRDYPLYFFPDERSL